VYGTMDTMEPRQHRDKLSRKAESSCLRRAPRAGRKGLGISRVASTVAWEPARAAGLLRPSFGTTQHGGQDPETVA
jgi:hypothetical protein